MFPTVKFRIVVSADIHGGYRVVEPGSYGPTWQAFGAAGQLESSLRLVVRNVFQPHDSSAG